MSARRAARVGLAALGLALVFVAALAVGVLLHANTPVARRLVQRTLSAALADAFRGDVTIERLGHLGARGVSGAAVRARDTEGRDVLVAEGVSVAVAWAALARSLLADEGPIEVTLPRVQVRDAQVWLETNATGGLRLADAFAPRAGGPDEPAGRPVSIVASRVSLEHIRIASRLAEAPAMDADIDDLRGALRVTGEGVVIDVDTAGLVTRGAPGNADVAGRVAAYIELPAAGATTMTTLSGAFDGAVGGLPVAIEASLRGARVDARVTVARVPGESVGALVPGLAIAGPVSARAEVHGELPRLPLEAVLTVGPGQVTANGVVTLGAPLRAAGVVSARRIDLATVLPGSARSDLGADATIDVTRQEGGELAGTFDLEVLPGVAWGTPLPGASLRGTFTGEGGRAQGTIHEPGAPTAVALALAMRPAGDVLSFEADARVPDLRRVTRLGPLASGRATVHAAGQLDLEGERITAVIDAEAYDLKRAEGGAQRASLRAAIAGPLERPSIDATLAAAGAVVAGRDVSEAWIRATGEPRALYVTASLRGAGLPEIEAAGDVAFAPLRVVRPRVALRRGTTEATVRADRVRLAGRAISVDAVVVEGLGPRLEGSARVAPERIDLRAIAEGVDVAALGRLVGEEGLLRAGTLSLDADLALGGPSPGGTLSLEVERASVGPVRDVDVRVEASLEGRRAMLRARLAEEGVGFVVFDAPDIELRGPSRDPASWTGATGRAALSAEADLARLVQRLPLSLGSLAPSRGDLSLRVELARAEKVDIPDLHVATRWRGVEAGASDGGPWVTGLDGELEARVLGASGRTDLRSTLADASGPVARIELGADAPYGALYDDPLGALPLLADMPFHARIEVPRRDLAALPAAIRPRDLVGAIELDLRASGTPSAPEITIAASSHGLAPSSAPPGDRADARLLARYDGRTFDGTLAIDTAGRRVAFASARAEVAVAELVFAGAAAKARGSGEVRLTGMPLVLVPGLDGRVRGLVSGRVEVADLGADAGARADLELADITIDRMATFTRGVASLSARDGRLAASTCFQQPDGYVFASGSAGMEWGGRLAPAIDPATPVALALRSERLRAAALAPFIGDAVSEIDGLLGANLEARLDLAKGDIDAEGVVTIDRGTVRIESFGDAFHDIKARVTAHDDELRIERLTARVVDGELRATGSARIEGDRLARVQARIEIPRTDAIPVAPEGALLAEIAGRMQLDADLQAAPDTVRIDAKIPDMVARIPSATRKEVQRLDPARGVRVGTLRGGALVPVLLGPPDRGPSERPLRIVARVALGDDVVLLRGTDLRARVEGHPVVTLAEELGVSGVVQIRDGFLEVRGRRFTIERGTVSFVGGDPKNPEIVATAVWTAPDATQVFADFVGPLETGKLTLRADPPRTADEIVSLLLFGTPAGIEGATTPGQEASGATRAAGLGGAYAAEGLSRALDELTHLDIRARVDTSQASSPRPEIEVQITTDLAIELSYALGTPPPGASQDRTYVTLDWRLSRNWSLATTVGDRGSAIADVLWRYRY